MKNKLMDLNNHLFEQLERLNDEDLKDDALKAEIKRAKTISSIASKIIDNGSLMLRGQEFNKEYLESPAEVFDSKKQLTTRE